MYGPGVILLERDEALRTLHDLLAEAGNGRGRVALIRGEAGIGKTTLIRTFIDQADTHVLQGGCDDLLAAQPLGPIWDMAFDEPTLDNPLRDDDRQATFRAVLELLSRGLRPTVMAIEDMHWADEATLDLVKYIGRRIDRTHGLLVLSYRDGEVRDDHPLRVALGDLPHGVVERIPLRPLSRESVTELAAGAVDVDSLWQLTKGNPFFVTEAIAAGGETVPLSIRDAVNGRVQRLSDSARAVVELAAVVPGRIEIAIVTEVLGDSGEAIIECESAGILEVDGDALRFRHELARRAVEGELAELERRRLNLETLHACERLGFDLARCAHHAREAEDAESIVRILPSAAKRAADMESHVEAVANLRALEPYLDAMTPEQLADHYDLWAYEEYLYTDAGSELIENALEIRRRLGDPEKLGNSLLVASRIAWVGARRQDAIALAEEATDVLGGVGGLQLAMAYSTLSQLAMLGNDEAETLAYADKVFSLVGDGPSEPRAHSLNNVGSVLMNNHYPEGVTEIEQAYRMSLALGASHEAARACVNLAWGYLYLKDLETAIAWIDQAMEIINEAEMPTFETYARTEKGLWHEYRGEWDLAEAVSRDVLESPVSLATSRATSTMTLAKVLARRGDPEASAHVFAAMDFAEKADEIQRLGPAAAVLVEYHWLGGEVPSHLLDRAKEIRDIAYSLGATWIGAEVGQWLRIAGLTDDLSDMAPEPYRLLAGGDWREAASWWAARGIPYYEAVALNTGDSQARIEALAILDRLGAAPLASRLRSELQSAGVKGVPRGPQRKTRDNPLGLTGRQADVLQLLSEGLTNAEIADRLFISIRTVDHHVSAILAKLGAASRSEAANTARSAGVLR
jgi:DNA-binding CsgD family transcriptional regulator/tetratricopeptide (TPR) repeat protein